MDTDNLSRLDLNLLVSLDLLLTEGSVSRAARRAGLSQSTMSHTLERLRELFGDPLLIRHGQGMMATPRAAALQPRLRTVLKDVQQLLQLEEAFEPSTSERCFTLACPDLLGPLLPALLERLTQTAPGVSLRVTGPLSRDISTALAEGEAELALLPTLEQGSGLMSRALGTLHWCVVARASHPCLGAPFTVERWTAFPHIQVHTGNRSPNRIGAVLDQARISRKIGLIVPAFLTALCVVSRSDMLFAAPRELVLPLKESLHLSLLEPPIPLPAIPVAQVWHERLQADPGQTWFRRLVFDVITQLLN